MGRLRIAAALCATMLAVAACTGDTGPVRDADETIVEPGDLSVFDVRRGDCFDLPGDANLAEVRTVQAVPCVEQHDFEVYSVFELADGPFPGLEAVDDEAQQRCLGAFEEFVGADYHESTLRSVPITPTADSWEEGDRTVFCALSDGDSGKLTGSMEGTGR